MTTGFTTGRRTFLKGGGALIAAMALGSVPSRAWANRSGVTDLGEPVHKTQTLSSAIGNGPDGRPLAYLCVEGNPTTTGEFAVVDIRAKKTIVDVRFQAGHSVGRNMSISPATGDVYFGTSDGSDMYRYRPGADDVEYLGAAMAGQRIWALRVGDDGTVWIGTYPGGLLLSYDPVTGAVTDHGQALETEQYIGSIEQVGGTIYCGTQPNGRLARFDVESGTFTEVELPQGPVASEITELNLRGHLLFVTTGGHTYVRDTATDAWTDEIPDTSGYGVSPFDPDDGNAVYVRSGAAIKRYRIDTGALEAIGWAPNAAPETWAWIDLADPAAPGLSLAFTYWNNGRIYARNIAAGTGYYHEPELMGSGAQLVAIGSGPDGNIYCGAYLSPPGMGRWDPDAGAFELLAGTSQVEGFGTFNGDLVFGRYPQGRLYRYDLDQPWSMGTNPGPTVDLEEYEQNRPQCFVQLDDTRVAVTTVPITGRHGGSVTLWTPGTNDVEVFRNVVQNQTPVSLVLHDGLLYGGTSINGGYGIDPVTPEAKLFAWDPDTHQVVFETVPVPGAPTVAGLVVDEDGHIWGIADNVLFEFDPAGHKVRRRIQLFRDSDGSRYGNDHVLLLHGGMLLGVTSNRVFALDRGTHDVEVLYDGRRTGEGEVAVARHLAVDRHGDLYFIGLSTHLLRYDLK